MHPTWRLEVTFIWHFSYKILWDEHTERNRKHLISIRKSHCSSQNHLWSEEEMGSVFYRQLGSQDHVVFQRGKCGISDILQLPT